MSNNSSGLARRLAFEVLEFYRLSSMVTGTGDNRDVPFGDKAAAPLYERSILFFKLNLTKSYCFNSFDLLSRRKICNSKTPSYYGKSVSS